MGPVPVIDFYCMTGLLAFSIESILKYLNVFKGILLSNVSFALQPVVDRVSINQSINQFLKWPKWHSHCKDH